MFPVDTIPAHYYEERAAVAEAARKLEQQQKQEETLRQQAAQAQAQSQTTTARCSTPSTTAAQSLPAPLSLPPHRVLASIFGGPQVCANFDGDLDTCFHNAVMCAVARADAGCQNTGEGEE
ncbi:uncharacterized protein LTR77_009852 [Saxophila tyrrhenica]|uniref:Uncharacterized protein n=1 Tax=Saxophila tyrrhenica TaxID=1690608 RepID=A0AAV9NXG6_9PEZI|nr:hypothetical protein LTR77_009852 [Saxophila tyrrhenica]